MNKAKMIAGILATALALTACGANPQPTQPQAGAVETIVAATLQAVTQEASGQSPAPTSQAVSPEAGSQPTAQPAGTPVSFQNVSFIIPPGLADGATPEVVPLADESTGSDPWGMAPEHIVFTLTNYPAIENNPTAATLHVYPAQPYADVNPWAANSIEKLRAFLANPGATVANDNAPTVPFLGAAAQQYAAQIHALDFNNGNGIRMISQYGQFPGPIAKDHSFYHYEGLTADGKYLVAARFPLILPLQSTSDNPSADGPVYPSDMSDTAGLEAYYQGMTEKLSAADPNSFQPALSQLDALIQSIQVK